MATVAGGIGADSLNGTTGDDVVAGLDGADTLVADAGADKVYGDIYLSSFFDINPDVFHYDATDINGNGNTSDNPADGASVTSWTDLIAVSADALSTGTAPLLNSGVLNGNDAIDFSGTTGGLTLASNTEINSASTYDEKSFAFFFETGSDISGTQVIYEQGGNTRGYILAIAEDPGNGNAPTLFAMAFNNSEWGAGHQYKVLNLGTVSTNTGYNVVLVHDATAGALVDRTWTGYLDGVQVAQETSVDVQRAHGDAIGFGDVNGGIKHPVTFGNLNNSGNEFAGEIGEFLSWNSALSGSEVTDVSLYLGSKWDAGFGGVAAGDSISGGDGNDSLYGNDGDDTVAGGADNDQLFGQDGADLLQGNTGLDKLWGGADGDVLQGGAENDSLYGEAGDDSLQGGGDADLLYGDEDPSAPVVDPTLPQAPDAFHFTGRDIDGDGLTNDNPGNGSSVTNWVDLVAANTAVGGTPDPTLSAGALNSNDVVDYAATSEESEFTSTSIINTSTFTTKSFAFTFTTGTDVSGTQVIFEQGGTVRGYILAIAPDPGNGNAPTLFGMIFNNSEWDSGHEYKNLNLGVVSTDTTYSVVLVQDSTGGTDATNTWTGYVDGSQVDQVDHVDQQIAHSGKPGLGGVADNIILPPNNTSTTSVNPFDGEIAEAISWNSALTSGQVGEVFDYLDHHWVSAAPAISYVGDDSLSGGAGNDTLYGQLGNDTLAGGADADKLYGGEGVNKLMGDGGNDTLYGEEGESSLFGGADNDLLIDTLGGDQIHLFGGSGNDVLQGVVDVDNYYAMAGGTGDDTLTLIQNAGSSVAEIFGDDTFSSYSESVSDGNDKITASGDGKIIIHGQRGNDTLVGGTGSQALYGGSGNDSLTGGADDDTLHGYLGNDTLIGGAANDVVNGSLGVDKQYGGSGDDTVYWDSADSVIRGGTGNGDVLSGWAGDDTIIMDGAMFGGGSVINGEFETVNLKGGDDLLFGDNTNGGDVSLQVLGGEGKDTMSMFGNGDDTLNGEDGNDLLYGGTGNDTVLGGKDNDILYGGDDNDTLDGGSGNDTLFGGANADVLFGGADVDDLFGGAGSDTLRGGAGDDLYYFGRGDGTDLIDDSSGDNTLVFFFGYNDLLYDDVLDGEVTVGYDTVSSIVTLTIQDGDDPGGATDGTISFAFGDVTSIELGPLATPTVYTWSNGTETFTGL
ncbi:calcium-binding protein [Rhodovibrionaceae bacterium A322]